MNIAAKALYISLLASGCLATTSVSYAQQLKPGYITWPSSMSFADYVARWNNDSVADKSWEDEEFFIARSKPRQMFRNGLTQVNPALDEQTDKRLIWWVPCGDANREGVHTDALPNGVYDSDVFSSWSYITHWGCWNSPHGWVTGALADVAHRNGVSVTGVASIPWGYISDEWIEALSRQGELEADDIARFLRYHGVNGLAYNSEFAGWVPTPLIKQHNELKKILEPIDPLYETIWYAGTLDNGHLHFDIGVTEENIRLFESASFFLNYNWNRPQVIERTEDYVRSQGLDPGKIYAAFNMQGAEPREGDNWNILRDIPYSIGLWGAYDSNMFWQDRGLNGSSPSARQRCYQTMNEQWFTNGRRNPAVHLPIVTKRHHRPDNDFAGMSALMSARSALSWNLDDEPFISRFNIGNGTFFNADGKRISDKEWYNIGIQDYMPTWRYWFAPVLLQSEVAPEYRALDAEICWDDAWYGGSCLRIFGEADREYLHLFKTDFDLQNDDELRITFKPRGGKADVRLVVAGAEQPGAGLKIREIPLDGKDNEWTVQTFSPGDLAKADLIALKFDNAADLDFLLGEIAITRGSYTVPPAPQVTNAKVLANNYKGVDGKLFWTMPGVKSFPEPTYNEDLGVSYYNLYAQEEGGEPSFMGVTSSWAGLVFSAPGNTPEAKIRFGVSAVGLDRNSESEIAWGPWVEKTPYEYCHDIAISRNVIKPNESFMIGYIDPLHLAGQWQLVDAEGREVFSGSGHEVVLTDGLPETGAYNLLLTDSTGYTSEYPGFVSVTPERVGAMPEVATLFVDGKPVVSDKPLKKGNDITFSYTGRQADGRTSRAVALDENWLGVNTGELGLDGTRTFSVAAWVKYDDLQPGLSNFLTIEDRTGAGWPYNHWGYFWSRVNDEGRFVHGSVDTAWGMRLRHDGTEGERLFYRYDDACINPGTWAHVAIVFEYESGTSNLRQHFYINGKKQHVGAWMRINKGEAEAEVSRKAGGDWSRTEWLADLAEQSGFDTDEPDFVPLERLITTADWIAFGGNAKGVSAPNGCIDDLQIWDKAMTADDVRLSMQGLDRNALPQDVLAFWDFEDDPDSDGSFPAAGRLKGVKARWWKVETGDDEGAGNKMFGEPELVAGCPFIPGEAYPITTTCRWTVDSAPVDGNGTDSKGQLKITLPEKGYHTVTVTLENQYGSSTVDFPPIYVKKNLKLKDEK